MRVRVTVAVAAALLLLGPGTGASAAPAPLVSASVSPGAILFGDAVEAQIDVAVDVRVDDPAAVRLSAPLGAWSLVAPATSQSTSAGNLVRRRFELTIACRSAACVPRGASEVVTLPAFTVHVRTRGGAARAIGGRWPRIVVASRLEPGAARAAVPPFRLQLTPPPARPSVSPSLAAALSDVLAALLALAGIALAAVEARRLLARPAAPVPPLERALRLLREARERPAPDRRRALDLLARVAPAARADAAGAAWSRNDPSPERLEELAREVEERS